jgi:hypothetical protein
VQGPSSLSIFSFDIKDYMNVIEVSSAPKPQEEEVTLSNAIKDRLLLMLSHLQKNVADLV